MSQRQRPDGALPSKPLRYVGAVGYLTALGAAIACGVLALGVFILVEARNDAWAQAVQALDNLALALERDISRNLTVIDLSMRGAEDAMRLPGLNDSPPELRQRAIFGPSLSVQYLGSMSVVDASGRVVETARGTPASVSNVAFREFFRSHKERSDRGLFISRPYLSRDRGNDPSIALSRRRSGPDGEFQGIVVGALRLAYFQDMFATFNLGPRGSVALVHGDGYMLARYPYRPEDIDTDIKAGKVFSAMQKENVGLVKLNSLFDGVRRVLTFRRIGEFPLFIVVGMSVDDIYLAWWRKAAAIGSLLIGFWISTIALCLLFRREMIRRLDSERALAAAAEELAVIASTDSLTGLANRRAFEIRFLEEWRRAIRAKTAIGLLMVDADHFKLYNDNYGHQAGDLVLKNIAACISKNLRRAGDVAVRYGGEEFAVVLPGIDLTGALEVGERIRRDVAALEIPHAAHPDSGITVSVGVASTTPSFIDAASDLLKKADEALYEAKRAGRNCVQLAADPKIDVAQELEARFAR